MNFVGISGNVVRNGQSLSSKNSNVVRNVATIAINRGKNSSFVPVSEWSRSQKQTQHFMNIMKKGNAVEVLGSYQHSNYKDKNGNYIHQTTVIANSIRLLHSSNFSMNTATVIGNLTRNAVINGNGNNHSIHFSVASNQYNPNTRKVYTSFVNVTTFTNNNNVLNFYRNNAKKGSQIEVINGYYETDTYKDNNGNYQDNSSIISDNIQLSYASNNRQANNSQQNSHNNQNINNNKQSKIVKTNNLPF